MSMALTQPAFVQEGPLAGLLGSPLLLSEGQVPLSSDEDQLHIFFL